MHQKIAVKKASKKHRQPSKRSLFASPDQKPWRILFIIFVAVGVLIAVGLWQRGQADSIRGDDVVIEGTLKVMVVENFKEQTSKKHVYVKDANGTPYLLKSKGKGIARLNEYETKPNAKVRVRGKKQDSSIYLNESNFAPSIETTDNSAIEILEDPTVPSFQAAAVTGTRRVAVVMFNHQDNPIQPYTQAQARSVVFTAADSTNKYYQEQSFGKVSLAGIQRTDGDVFGWVTISKKSTDKVTYSDGSVDCDYYGILAAVDQAMKAQGVTLDAYDHVIFASPRNPSCRTNGYGLYSSPESGVNYNFIDFYYKFVIVHEIGHNLGLEHATSVQCKNGQGVPVTWSTSCTYEEYGDSMDAMGQGRDALRGHFSNFRKGALGWLTAANTHTVATTGNYTLKPIATSTTGIQSLRVPRGDGNYIYVEYRQPIGFDASLSPASFLGLALRIAPDYGTSTVYTPRNKTTLLDMSPGVISDDVTLLPGKSYYDVVSGKQITLLSKTSSEAYVRVEVPPAPQPPPPPPPTPPPVLTQPDLIVTEIQPINGTVSQPIRFVATIKNQGDGATPTDCGSTKPSYVAGKCVIGIAFRVNGTLVSWNDIHTDVLAPGASVTLVVSGGTNGSAWTPTVAGTVNVVAHVDDINRITNESNETNNQLTSTLTVAPATVPKPGDVDGNGVVNGLDLSAVLTNYGKYGQTRQQGDLDGNGLVNALDLSGVLSNYGT